MKMNLPNLPDGYFWRIKSVRLSVMGGTVQLRKRLGRFSAMVGSHEFVDGYLDGAKNAAWETYQKVFNKKPKRGGKVPDWYGDF